MSVNGKSVGPHKGGYDAFTFDVTDALRPAGIDTLVTGELKQAAFNRAQEEGLNLYLCGHYATETLGVRALAAELAARFDLPWTFLPSPCPL